MYMQGGGWDGEKGRERELEGVRMEKDGRERGEREGKGER